MIERKGLRGAALRCTMNARAHDAAEHGLELRGEEQMNTGKKASIGNNTASIKIGFVKRHVSPLCSHPACSIDDPGIGWKFHA